MHVLLDVCCPPHKSEWALIVVEVTQVVTHPHIRQGILTQCTQHTTLQLSLKVVRHGLSGQLQYMSLTAPAHKLVQCGCTSNDSQHTTKSNMSCVILLEQQRTHHK